MTIVFSAPFVRTLASYRPKITYMNHILYIGRIVISWCGRKSHVCELWRQKNNNSTKNWRWSGFSLIKYFRDHVIDSTQTANEYLQWRERERVFYIPKVVCQQREISRVHLVALLSWPVAGLAHIQFIRRSWRISWIVIFLFSSRSLSFSPRTIWFEYKLEPRIRLFDSRISRVA